MVICLHNKGLMVFMIPLLIAVIDITANVFLLFEGCAPPPGLYEIKPGDLRGVASFDKSDRFKPPKAGEWFCYM